MATSKLIGPIITFLKKVFWPWFKVNIWPAIQKQFIKIGTWAIMKLVKIVIDFMTARSKENQQDAKNKAQEAEEHATKSSNKSEKDKYDAIANVWHEVAEQFRRENEDLKIKINEFSLKAQDDFSKDIENLDPSIDNSAGKPIMLIGEERISFPDSFF